jgi:hypothetical protein
LICEIIFFFSCLPWRLGGKKITNQLETLLQLYLIARVVALQSLTFYEPPRRQERQGEKRILQRFQKC